MEFFYCLMPIKDIQFSFIAEAKKHIFDIYEKALDEYVIYRVVVNKEPIFEIVPEELSNFMGCGIYTR